MFSLVFLALLCVPCSGQEEGDTWLKRNAASWAADLTHADPKTRRAAAFALSKLSKYAHPYLGTLKSQLLIEVDPSVRVALAGTLGEMAGRAADELAPTLITSLEKEKHDAARRALVLALGKCGERAAPALAMLCKLLDDPDGKLRENTAWAIGQLGPRAEPAIPRLTTALVDSEEGVRAEAVQALGNLGPLARETIPLLIKMLSDKSSTVQEQAVLALRKMGPHASSAIAPLLNLAESEKQPASLRQAALITLESIWPTGLKEDLSWRRLQTLTGSSEESVKATALQVARKVEVLRK